MGSEPSQRRMPLEASDQLDAKLEDAPSQTDTTFDQQRTMEFDTYPSQSLGMGYASGASPLNMGTMANVLPDYRSPAYSTPSYPQGFHVPSNSTPSTVFQYPHNPQFAGQTRPPYDSSFAQQYADSFLHNQQARASHPGYMTASGYQATHVQGQHQYTTPSYYQHQQHLAQNYSTAYAPSPQAYSGLNATFNPYGPVYSTRPNPSQLSGQMRPGNNYYFGPAVQTGGEALYAGPAAAATAGTGGLYAPPVVPGLSRHSSDSSLKNAVPRGPPRKPRQSGHALWVGNLPPGTHVADLKDHFARDATKDIESVFLIAKSNCAFVNYKTESACADAMARFHDSRFHGVRLVCRLRRGSAATSSGTPVTQTVPVPPTEGQGQDGTTPSTSESTQPATEPTPADEATTDTEVPSASVKSKEKFFVVKSLTLEDLESSVRTSIWATQAHNEAALNKAYETAENVYLIFSANKSGEYFGYARMVSSIEDESTSKIEAPARAGPTLSHSPDLPANIPTAATEFAPKGRIIDDSARGTIFWEADVDTDEEEPKVDDSRLERGTESDDPDAAGAASPPSFGKPFKIEWLSTDRLPFYRTRGLRNAWNANREVKIARDGTELEPSVGRKLVSMFSKPHAVASPVNTRSQASQGPIYPTTLGYMQPPPPTGRPY